MGWYLIFAPVSHGFEEGALPLSGWKVPIDVLMIRLTTLCTTVPWLGERCIVGQLDCCCGDLAGRPVCTPLSLSLSPLIRGKLVIWLTRPSDARGTVYP